MTRLRLTASQRRRLRGGLREAEAAGPYRRMLAVLELDRGRSAAEIADLLGVTRQSVYNWARAYDGSPDPGVLQDRYGVGRPRLWTGELLASLQTALRRRPDQWGYPGPNWTVPLLQERLEREGGRRLSGDTIRRQLRRLGYVWKRSRYVLPPDPEREKKTRDSATNPRAAAARRRAARGVALAEDETELRLFPPLRAGWAIRGRPAPVPISGWNAKRVLFGAINLETGHRIFLARGHQRAADCQVFFETIRRSYRGRHVSVLLDEHPGHTAAGSQALAEHLEIELLWLPKRSPHLNPMDHLWRHGKEVVSANHQYEAIETQAERFVGYLAGLSPRDALRKAGTLSENFWLK